MLPSFGKDRIIEDIPSQKSRNAVSLNMEYNGNQYVEKIISSDDSYDFVNIKTVPKNLHILKMDNYWYQISDNDERNKSLVSKKFILKLLRDDVRMFLKKLKL